eukprot:gene21436-28402_t
MFLPLLLALLSLLQPANSARALDSSHEEVVKAAAAAAHAYHIAVAESAASAAVTRDGPVHSADDGPVLPPWVTPELLAKAASFLSSATRISDAELVARAKAVKLKPVPLDKIGKTVAATVLPTGSSSSSPDNDSNPALSARGDAGQTGGSSTAAEGGVGQLAPNLSGLTLPKASTADSGANSNSESGSAASEVVTPKNSSAGSSSPAASQAPPCEGGCPPPPLWEWEDKAAAHAYSLNATGLPVLTPKDALMLPVGPDPVGRALPGHEQCRSQQYVEDPQGSQYRFLANASVRQDGQSYRGDRSRLRVALDRYTKGENITIAFVGGSITAGQGALDGMGYVSWAENLLRHLLGHRIHVHNGAVPGTVSHYMSVCHNVHVPDTADIIFIEYAVNDPEWPNPGPPMNNPCRRSFERLLRKLLNYPRRPAVVLMHSFIWHTINPWPGAFWSSSEREFHEFAMYYKIPEISVKAATWHLMKAGVEGYRIERHRSLPSGALDNVSDHENRGKLFYWDQVVSRSIPEPMLADNWESKSDKCFIGLQFVQSVITPHEGWEWKDDARDGAGRPKFGFISETVGSSLKIRTNTTSPNAQHKHAMVGIEIAHLKSYANMGKFKLSCEDGCSCIPVTIDGHHGDRTSQLFLSEARVSQGSNCTLVITVLEESSSGKHKIAGVMISEEVMADSVKNFGAIDLVNDVVGDAETQGTKGVFDMVSYGRRS